MALARKHARTRLVCLLLLASAVAQAQEMICVLTAPARPLTAGGQGSIWLNCLNNSSKDIRQTFVSSISGALTFGTNSFKTVLLPTARTGKTATIAPGGFARQEYVFDVPPNAAGQMILTAGNYNQVVMQGENAAPGIPLTAQKSAPPSTNETASAETSGPLFQGFLGRHIFPYEPIYFLQGTYPAAEFQFSLKY